MACFTRFFNGRQKNSFSPDKDENKDTVLDTRDSTVQIGRYIRRDETTLFTPKSTERQRPTIQRQSILVQHEATVANVTHNQDATRPQVAVTNGHTLTQAMTQTTPTTTKTTTTKKFTSFNGGRNVNSFSKANGSLNVASPTLSDATISNGGLALARNHLHPQAGSKLKERRPTALPTEQPKIERDEVEDSWKSTNSLDSLDGSGVKQDDKDKNINGTTPTNGKPATFFIGHTHAPGESDSDNDDVVVVTPMKNDFATRHEVSSLNLKQQQRDNNTTTLLQLNTKNLLAYSISAQSTPLPSPSVLSCSTPSPLAIRNTFATTSKLRTKFPSNTSNKLRKFGRTDTATSTLSQHVEVEPVHIPPPPPLPPQPLCVPTPSPSLSLISKYNRSSNLSESQTCAGRSKGRGSAATLTETDMTTQASPTSTTSKTTATHRGRNARLTEDSGTAVTLHEALQSQCDDFSLATTSQTGTIVTAPNSDARDSGVQSEESNSSPKESDSSSATPKSHRIEGGLIFARANLPKQKDVHIEYIEKDEQTRNLIRNAIEKNDFLNNYMDTDRKERVIDAMEMVRFHANDYIINENDEGSEIYVSEEGEFDVIKQEQIIGEFAGETVFGELAILYNAKRFASIRAVTEAKVWKIDRDKFRKIMVISGDKEREENLNFLRSAPFLNDLAEEVLSKVVDLLQRKFFATNTCIVREGDIGNEFFIIRGGTVTIKKLNDAGEERVVDNRKRGDYFGEQALLNADCRQASVYADAPGTEVLKLDREAFISYLGTIPQLCELPSEKHESVGRDSNRKSEFDNEYAHIELTDLKKIATLGAGAFGKVDLVSYESDKIFALKIVKKIDIVKQDQIEHIYSEKHVMMKCRSSPFIIELFKTFRNDKFVYFLMEACMGGDVWTVMSQRRFFDEKTARFIAGCVVEAFDFLHSHNIIYRDLKPENLMLTTDGYCKLVDFGFAKHIPTNHKTHTFAGTPEYVAPEIILDRGHDRSVDYWALGILVFELLMGKTPFRGQNQIKIYQQILGGIDVVQMPSKIPKSAQNLIKALCKQLPAERLGYQRKGILDIKKHSWFDSLDWQKLKNKQLPSPIERPISSKTDLRHFGPSGVENESDPPPETSGWDVDF